MFLALAFALPFSVYLLTLAPGLTWAHHGADGGDLVTAAYTLGIPHPPGYPTYTSLAWLFTRLPLGSVAWRVNLLSALSTATATALVYWTVIRLIDEKPGTPAVLAALGAAWSYAFAPLVWSQSLIAEVYGLAGLWTALILGLTTLPRSRGRLLTLGLVWSLGLGVHLTLVSLMPVVVWAVWRVGRKAWRWTLLGFLVGLVVWLYLPLRAGRGSVTWGQPTTLEGLCWLVSGALYRDYLFALPVSALGERSVAWVQTWRSGLGLTGVGLATLGLTGLASRQPGFGPRLSSKGWLLATGFTFVLLNLYALGYNTADSVVYLVPAFVIGSIWLGAGLMDLFSRILGWGQWGRWLTPLMLTIALATPTWMLAHNWAALDLSGERETERFCQTVMRDAPPRAILLTATDQHTFTLWYCQHVEGLRPDVAVVDEGLRGFDWYRAGLQSSHADLWTNQAGAAAPMTLTDGRPHCRIRREAQTVWLDCQNSTD